MKMPYRYQTKTISYKQAIVKAYFIYVKTILYNNNNNPVKGFLPESDKKRSGKYI
jgi:hypothetical protein